MPNTISAKDFFNSISESYKAKYEGKSRFHSYFFSERLEKSAGNLHVGGLKILDVGAGTGDLYDFLLLKNSNFIYTATDVAEGMLANSRIPIKLRIIGKLNELQLPYENYDQIFFLGVTTYLTHEELKSHLKLFRNLLADCNSELVISFTNKDCIDGYLRILLQPIIRLLAQKNSVLSQDFLIKRYRIVDILKLMKEMDLEIKETLWLNHTVFPFNLLLQKGSIWLAKKFDKITNKRLLSYLSSDFLVKVKLNN